MLGLILQVWSVVSVLVTNTVLLLMTWAAHRKRRGGDTAALHQGPAVSVIRPFRGTDADALHNHRTLLLQEYSPLEVLFVCASTSDPGANDVRIACRESPRTATFLVAASDVQGGSDKARSMIAGWHATSSPYVAYCDSDIALEPDAIGRCMSQFERAGVGAVFAHCVNEASSPLGKLSMLTLTADAYAFLVGCERRGLVPFLQGGLMILSRQAVEESGGIGVIAHAVGDDTRLGRCLRRKNYAISVADFVIVHRSEAESFLETARRYRRWLTCHRAEVPVGFWAELCLNPTVAPLLALPFWASQAKGSGLLLLSMFLRFLVTVWIDRGLLRRHGVRLGGWVLLRPLADVLHMAMCISILVHPRIVWRGLRYSVKRNGDLFPLGRSRGCASSPSAELVDASR